MLLDRMGFQLSVGDYVYSITTSASDHRMDICKVTKVIPEKGKVQVMHICDKHWRTHKNGTKSTKQSSNVMKMISGEEFKSILIKKELLK